MADRKDYFANYSRVAARDRMTYSGHVNINPNL